MSNPQPFPPHPGPTHPTPTHPPNPPRLPWVLLIGGLSLALLSGFELLLIWAGQ